MRAPGRHRLLCLQPVNSLYTCYRPWQQHHVSTVDSTCLRRITLPKLSSGVNHAFTVINFVSIILHTVTNQVLYVVEFTFPSTFLYSRIISGISLCTFLLHFPLIFWLILGLALKNRLSDLAVLWYSKSVKSVVSWNHWNFQSFHVITVSLRDIVESLNFLGISRNNWIYAPVISGNHWRWESYLCTEYFH